jgi:hypothetical protein
MRIFSRILICLTALGLTLPAVAAAKQPATIAPPGDSAVSQYVEDVPTAKGGTPSGPPAGSHTGTLTPGQARGLDRLGPNGRLLASVVNATAPSPATAAGSGQTGGSAATSAGGSRRSDAAAGSPGANAGIGAAQALTASGTRSPAASLASAAVGGGLGGVGIVLPAIMLAAALGAVAWSVRRRRTGT